MEWLIFFAISSFARTFAIHFPHGSTSALPEQRRQ
jgi:hypothetical protein